MNLMLNKNCNLNCSYCFAPKNSGSNITDENFEKYIEFLKKSDVPIARLLGGEPTLHPKFMEYIIKLLNDEFFKIVHVFTNGLKLTPDIMDQIMFDDIKSQKMSYLINLNSPNDIGKDKFDIIINNINYLISKTKTYVPVNYGINIYKNDFDYEYIINATKLIGAPAIRFSIVCPNTKSNFMDLNYYRGFLPRIIQFAKDCKNDNIKLTMDCRNIPYCLYMEYELDKYISTPMRGIEYSNNCSPILDIGTDLSVMRCFPFQSKNASLLSEHNTCKDMYTHFEELDKVDNLNQKIYFNECTNCEYLGTDKCQGGCRANYINEEE